jgi:hypothetical protein
LPLDDHVHERLRMRFDLTLPRFNLMAEARGVPVR